MTTLYIVVPCYNEQEVLPETAKRLSEKLSQLAGEGKVSPESRVLFVDDGSRDQTWRIICDYTNRDERFAGVKLSRNKGHQNALLAGLQVASGHCDCAISLDADLQDDINAIDEMLVRFSEGCEVVYGVRSSRATDTAFKRLTARSYYKLMRLLGVDLVYDHADYRLMSRRALEALLSFPEVNLFLRGVVPLVGFCSAEVAYDRGERFAGESKYPLKKMVSFALEGITSFSVRPIRMITLLGILIFGASCVALFGLLLLKLAGHTVQGWTTLMGSIWLLGGLQLLGIGVIGEYVGRVYQEVKRRPHYIIEEIKLH